MKRNHFNPLFFVTAIVLIVSLACGIDFGTTTEVAPTQRSVPLQPTPQSAIPTPQSAQPTVQIDQPTEIPPTAIVASSQFFTEEWDNGFGAWVQEVELNSPEGDKSKAIVSVENGRLSFDLGKWLIAYVFYPSFNYDNVRIDVRVDNRGTNINNVLLVCRKSDEGHYLVNIANSGLFAIYAYDGSRGSYARIADGGSNKIKQGKDVNEYTLICRDRTLSLLINGFDTRSYTDNQYAFREGQVGVGVASEGQLPVKVEFDWVKVSEP